MAETSLPQSEQGTYSRRMPAAWRRRGDLSKRLFDILVALSGMLLLAPLYAMLSLLVRRDSPGPVIFRGPRLGRHGRIFHILKFRTMYEEPSSYAGPRLTARDDPRITPFGRWLRETKLNELPQLWNVLVGEMSLVGPRPEDPELAESWPPEAREEILSVRPGITSPASVLFRDEERILAAGNGLEDYLGSVAPSKMRLDQLYVRNRSFLLDLDILFWTLLVLFPTRRVAEPAEERLFVGPFSRLVRRYVTWFTIDILVTFAALGLNGLLWRSFGPLNVGLGKSVLLACAFALAYSLTGALLGVNRISWEKAGFTDALDLLPAVGMAAALTLLANMLWPGGNSLPAGLVVVGAGVALSGYVLVRYRARFFRSLASRWLQLRGGAADARERVLIVGGGQSGQFVSWWLAQGGGADGFRVVGYVDDDLFLQNTRIRGSDVIGKCADIPALVRRHDVGIILFAIHNISSAERARLLELCRRTSARLLEVPDVLERMRAVAGEARPAAHGPSPAELAEWLAGVEESLAGGDLDGLRSQLDDLRLRLNGAAHAPSGREGDPAVLEGQDHSAAPVGRVREDR